MNRDEIAAELFRLQDKKYARHFYFKSGYEAIGGFRLDGNAYEVIFAKPLTGQ